MTRSKNVLLGLVAASATALVCGISLFAQLAFDVSSIKESQALSDGGSLGPLPGGVRGTNIPVPALLLMGYDLQSFQIVGLPAWTRQIRFDVLARSERTISREERSAMIRAMLVDRFQLQFHRETRPVD